MIKINYEEYYNDYHRKDYEKTFASLQELESWIFSQMKQDYSDPEKGWYRMSFPTPARAKRICSDGPWRIEFMPVFGGPTYWIHQIRNDRGITFSDGTRTAGQKHWSKEVQAWLEECNKHQYAPKFSFVE